MKTGQMGRLGQAFSKLGFCIRVAADPGSFLRLVTQTKKLVRYPKTAGPRVDNQMRYDPAAAALAYEVRFHACRRTIYLRTYAGDIWMFFEIFWKEVYRLPSVILENPKLIVDAGANIGMTALYFSILYPEARIFCIEPDAYNFKLLKKNLAADKERIVLIEGALYDRDGSVALARERYAYNSKIDERKIPEGSVMVDAMKMNTLMDRYGLEWIDLLKIDVEGAEDKIFDGGVEWLVKVGVVLIEMHHPESVEPVGRIFLEKGFSWRPWGQPGGGDPLYLASRMELKD